MPIEVDRPTEQPTVPRSVSRRTVLQDPMNLVRAAILAANAHNTQPWLFVETGDRIEMFADMTRTIGAMDQLVPVSQEQNNSGWLSGTRDTQLPTAAAFGALTVVDPRDPVQRLQAGRTWQRLQLAATVDGLVMQPLCQIPERIDREVAAGLPTEFGTAFAAMLPADVHAVMTFRIGYPTAVAPPSPRRPAADVVLT